MAGRYGKYVKHKPFNWTEFRARLRDLCLLVLALTLFLLGFNAHGQTLQTNRFVLKLENAVELSSTPSIRRLEREGVYLSEALERNGVDAKWIRAGSRGTHILEFGDSVRPSDRQALINRMASDPGIDLVAEDTPLSLQVVAPNDPSFTQQWALSGAQGAGSAKFDSAWDVFRGSADTVIAVADTGIVYDTPELYGRLLAGYDFIADPKLANDSNGRDSDASDPGDWIDAADQADPTFSSCSIDDSSWHGTFIASQIASNTNNGSSIASADWNAKILPVRVSGKCFANSSDLYDGMLWAAGLSVPGVPTNPNPADVISVSLGANTACTASAQDTINRVNAVGVVVVVAAGNGAGAAFMPANCSGVLSVGALDRDGSRASYSAIGSNVDLMAPGGGNTGGVRGLANTGTTSPVSPVLSAKTGTSFAAPYASAVAGMVKHINPNLTSAQVIQVLKDSAAGFVSPIGSVCGVSDGVRDCDCTVGVCGDGMLDASAAVSQARTTIPVANGTVSINGSSLVLDASLSQVTGGRTIASYAWQQVGGSTVLSTTSASSVVNLSTPAGLTDLVFQLTVTDSVGESHVTLAAQRAGSGAAVATTPSVGQQSSAPVSSPAPSVSGGGGGGGGSVSWFGLLILFWLVFMARRCCTCKFREVLV